MAAWYKAPGTGAGCITSWIGMGVGALLGYLVRSATDSVILGVVVFIVVWVLIVLFATFIVDPWWKGKRKE